MNALRLAISFLTIFPVYQKVADEKKMAASLYCYPLVGFLLGSLLALTSYAGMRLSLARAGDVLIVVLWIILTGGLHLDGLMDSADGLFSGRNRERKLEIMKDSRVGSMAVITVAALLMLKISFLGLLPYPFKYWVLLLAPAVGRSMMLLPIAYYPYARQKPGLGRAFGNQASRAAFPIALLFLSIAACLGSSRFLLLVGAAITVFISLGAAYLISRSLGGHTGDTYGALCEFSEAVFLIIMGIGLHF
ncbi:MAG: adenosylcobinamide-GDP ribazoletransferase [Syntrophomonadaceae bacterium]